MNEETYRFLVQNADEVIFNFKRNDVEIIKGSTSIYGDSLDEALENFLDYFNLEFN